MQKFEPLLTNKFYHIYNRGINSCDLFRQEPENYEHFLRLYEKFIHPVADTYAWVLMPNHFHLLVRIHDAPDLTGFQNLSGLEGYQPAKPPHQPFSNLFNAYTKAFNKRFERHGALFERPFRRKQVNGSGYLKRLLIYIHQNPVHHGFCAHPMEYPWSSYLTCVTLKPTRLQRDKVIGWFGSNAAFNDYHNKILDPIPIEEWLAT
ncbi:MAG: hypothetical protein KKA07_18885 [Bacteroidetes bacterium]|nr:hypothetical protein [Bacteroidota bacterium]